MFRHQRWNSCSLHVKQHILNVQCHLHLCGDSACDKWSLGLRVRALRSGTAGRSTGADTQAEVSNLSCQTGSLTHNEL